VLQPLNHIIGYSELLLEDLNNRTSDQLESDLVKIHTAARTLLSLLNSAIISPDARNEGALDQPYPQSRPKGKANSSFSIDLPPGGISSSHGHILVVDDDASNCELLSRRLGQNGYRISVTENGRQALALIGREPFDLVLLDVLMPEMDGFETCEQMKSCAATREIPVIFMTALTDVVDKVRGFENGAVDYITKPFQYEEVLARIGTHLALQRLTRKLQESEQRLGCVIESAMDAIVALNADGDVILFNPTSERIFQCRAEDAIGHSVRRLLSEHLYQTFIDYVGTDASRPRPPIWVEQGVTARRMKGEAFPVEATLSQAMANGRPLFTLILRDVQDRQNAELERQKLAGLNRYLQEELRVSENEVGESLIGASQDLKEVMDKVQQVAPTAATVLVLGETGTGKEVIARTIHALSQRADKVMVRLNCAAIPSDLIESELFGQEKGAFTSAISRKLGRFELADQGTLFLDEVGELSQAAQSKLLRVLQEGEFERVGGTETRRVDVRIIAATNRNLSNLVTEGLFRADLYYRLNVFPISLPPLRQRKKDLPLLVDYFVRTYVTKYGKHIETVSARAMTAMQSYDWPGNARELQHLLERAVILSRGKELALDEADLKPQTMGLEPLKPSQTLDEVERNHILSVLDSVKWRVSGKGGAAELLGLKASTLEFRMKKLGIARPQ
jgi:PAS domain S-box-containing protein